MTSFTLLAFLAELFQDGPHFQDKDGNFIKLVYMQHMSIYGIFVLHGITDLFTYHGVPIIRGTNYLSAVLAFFWFGIALYFHGHMHGKEPMELVLHVLPVPVIMATGVTILLEMLWKRGVATTLVRTYFLLTLGTWFWQMAFMLYDHTKFPGTVIVVYILHLVIPTSESVVGPTSCWPVEATLARRWRWSNVGPTLA